MMMVEYALVTRERAHTSPVEHFATAPVSLPSLPALPVPAARANRLAALHATVLPGVASAFRLSKRQKSRPMTAAPSGRALAEGSEPERGMSSRHQATAATALQPFSLRTSTEQAAYRASDPAPGLCYGV